MSALVERSLAWLLKNKRAHDLGLFHKSAPFAKHPDPTISLSCKIGPSGSDIPAIYSAFDKGIFPTLKWTAPAGAVAEYLLVVEDPDAPLAQPVVHGLYYGIPPIRSQLTPYDFEPVGGASDYSLKGGFKYGLNRRETVYMPPRGFLGHGPHRVFFQLVALDRSIDQGRLSSPASKQELVQQIDGKVKAWGNWIGMWERKE